MPIYRGCFLVGTGTGFITCWHWHKNSWHHHLPERLFGTPIICAGTIFRLGSKNWLKNNQDNQIQSITLCKMHFSKKGIQLSLGQSPRSWEFSRIFVTVCKVTLNCKLHKKFGGAGCTSCSPIILLGEHCSPCSCGSRTFDSYWHHNWPLLRKYGDSTTDLLDMWHFDLSLNV